MDNNLGNNTPPTPEPNQINSAVIPRWYQHKGVITIIILAILAFGVCWFYLYSFQSQNIQSVAINHKPVQTPPSNQLSNYASSNTDIPNWVTYDDQTGFQFQYPPDWYLNTGLKQIFLNSPARVKLMSGNNDGSDIPDELTISIVPKTEQQSISDFAKSYQKGWFVTYKSSFFSTISGKNVVTFSDIGEAIGHAPQEAVFIDNDTTAIILTLNDSESAETPAQTKTLNQILSTFKFISHKPVTVKEIEVKAGIDISPQQGTTFTFLTAKGHSLLWTHGDNKILYDGQPIYKKTIPNIGILGATSGAIDAIGLSRNGLHYGYAIATDSNRKTDLYIDGQKVASGHDIGGINISDDGKTYMYTTENYIYKNDKIIYQNDIAPYGVRGTFSDLKMSVDGSTFMVVQNNVNSREIKLILNGEVVATPNYDDAINDRFYSDLSSNGKHYIYQDTDGLFVDGKFKHTTPTNFAVGHSQITDDGHYTFCDQSNTQSRGYIDTKAYYVCNITINSDASHYLRVNDSLVYIDGEQVIWKVINPQPQREAFELDGDTLYAYSLVQ